MKTDDPRDHLQAIADLIFRHDCDSTFTDDAEQVIQRISAILRAARVQPRAFPVSPRALQQPPVEPYGPAIDGPEIGQGIDAPWLDEPPDSERTQQADRLMAEAKERREERDR